MTAVDETTGLPKLPDNFRWLVTDSQRFGRFPKAHLIVVLEEGVSKSSVKKHEVKRGWWRKPLHVEETKSWTDWNYHGSELVLGYHPVAVRNAAIKLLKAQQAVVDLDGLKGAYPPKRLVVES